MENHHDCFRERQEILRACETPLGWDGCKEYVAAGASFQAQSEPNAISATLFITRHTLRDRAGFTGFTARNVAENSSLTAEYVFRSPEHGRANPI